MMNFLPAVAPRCSTAEIRKIRGEELIPEVQGEEVSMDIDRSRNFVCKPLWYELRELALRLHQEMDSDKRSGRVSDVRARVATLAMMLARRSAFAKVKGELTIV
jgi:hypothetical protein